MATDVRWSSKPDRVKAVTVRCCQCFWTCCGSPVAVQVGPGPAPGALLADKAYSSRAHRTLLRTQGITAVIPERADQQGHRLRRGSAGGRPVSFDTEKYKDRNVIERSYEKLKQWRGLATRYDKLAVIFRGGAILRSIVLWLRTPLGDTP